MKQKNIDSYCVCLLTENNFSGHGQCSCTGSEVTLRSKVKSATFNWLCCSLDSWSETETEKERDEKKAVTSTVTGTSFLEEEEEGWKEKK